MSDDAERLIELKRQVESLNRNADRADGAHRQLLVRLKAEFDCQDTKAAGVELKRLDRERTGLERELKEGLDWYIREYSSLLGVARRGETDEIES